jgi:hypothetical protein
MQGMIEEEKDEDVEVDEVDESESELDVLSDGSEAADGMEDAGKSIEDLVLMAVKAFDHLTDSSRERDMPHQTLMPVLEAFVSH